MTDIDPAADIELHVTDGQVTVTIPLAGPVTSVWLRCYQELALAAQTLAERFGASFDCIVGEDLVPQNFPLIHAVGMASSRAPRTTPTRSKTS